MNYKQIMMADGAPKGLFLTAAQRAETWEGRPLTTVPLFKVVRDDTPETAAFRAQAKADAIVALKNRLARSAARKQTKAIDYSKMRWDAMRNKFVPLAVPTAVTQPEPKELKEFRPGVYKMKLPALPVAPGDYSRVTKDRAEELARLNDVWDDKYSKLSGGLLVMTVTNRLKGLVRKGGAVSWE